MNHKWKENKCTSCGAERYKSKFGYSYARGIHFFGLNKRPDCIDWDLENSKTID